MYDPLGPDGAARSVGVMPVSHSNVQASGAHPNASGDDGPMEPSPYVPTDQDTGSGSFSGVPANQVAYNLGEGDYYVFQGPSQKTELGTAEVVVTGLRQNNQIQSFPNLGIEFLIGNNYILTIGDPGQSQTSSGPTQVTEIEVTAPRYDPCAGLSFNLGKIADNSGESHIALDTSAEFASQTYDQTDLNNIQVPGGYVLQNKLGIVESDGKTQLVEVLQQVGHSNYVIAIEGTHSTDVLKEDAANIADAGALGPGATAYATNVANFLTNVFATIHNNDPGATVYISGHSYGGGLAIMGSSIAYAAGIPVSQIQTVALAPVGALAAMRANNISYAGPWQSAIHSYFNAGDFALALAGNNFYGYVTIHGENASKTMGDDIIPTIADHSDCLYVKSMPRGG